jgi:hypothetical protein
LQHVLELVAVCIARPFLQSICSMPYKTKLVILSTLLAATKANVSGGAGDVCRLPCHFCFGTPLQYYFCRRTIIGTRKPFWGDVIEQQRCAAHEET